MQSYGQTKPPGAAPNTFLLGATSIVGYNISLRHHPDVCCIVTSRSRQKAVAHLPRLALHAPVDLAAFCAALPAEPTIIYCDAVCDVAKCEEDPQWAEAINIGNLERTLELLPAGTRFVYMSSDHVFGHDGIYTESSEPCPVSLYGAMRVKCEKIALRYPGALVLRSGLPIGLSIDGKSGHLQWLKYRLGRGLPVTIIRDESRTAVPLPLLADRVVALVRSDLAGIRHISSSGFLSRPRLAQALKEYYQFPGELTFSTRCRQPAPHLGRIHITTEFDDPLASPLPSPLEMLETWEFLREDLPEAECLSGV